MTIFGFSWMMRIGLDLGGIHCSIKGSINFTTGITEGYVFAPYDLAKDESEFVFDTRKQQLRADLNRQGLSGMTVKILRIR